MKELYSIFRLLFEISTLFCVGHWGFHLITLGPWRYVVGLSACAIVVLVWATWGAPAAANRLQGIPHFVLELSIYLTAAAALYFSGQKQWALVYAIVGIVNTIIHHNWLPTV